MKQVSRQRLYQRMYPDRQRARGAVQTAIRSGKLVRPEYCQECGKACKTHGHHEDYSKPLEVDWLCSLCHGKRHRTAPEKPPTQPKSVTSPINGRKGGRPVREEKSILYAIRLPEAQRDWLKAHGGAARLREIITAAMKETER